MSPEPPYGAARERTALAWRRTSLAFVLNGVLLVRASDAWLQVAALLVLAFATGIAAASATAFREPRISGWPAGRRRGEILALAAALVGVLDVVAIATAR
jgi:uncharacterized membrane protein YidH (DUF202 family)